MMRAAARSARPWRGIINILGLAGREPITCFTMSNKIEQNRRGLRESGALGNRERFPRDVMSHVIPNPHNCPAYGGALEAAQQNQNDQTELVL
jgi:hypothetical protein